MLGQIGRSVDWILTAKKLYFVKSNRINWSYNCGPYDRPLWLMIIDSRINPDISPNQCLYGFNYFLFVYFIIFTHLISKFKKFFMSNLLDVTSALLFGETIKLKWLFWINIFETNEGLWLVNWDYFHGTQIYTQDYLIGSSDNYSTILDYPCIILLYMIEHERVELSYLTNENRATANFDEKTDNGNINPII